jgi:hypothetical protein
VPLNLRAQDRMPRGPREKSRDLSVFVRNESLKFSVRLSLFSNAAVR